ncbi:unnamed protein product, partial [Ascophyllum nodosum]
TAKAKSDGGKGGGKKSMEDGGEAAEKALSAGTGDSTALVASASRSEDQQAGRSGSAARASS